MTDGQYCEPPVLEAGSQMFSASLDGLLLTVEDPLHLTIDGESPYPHPSSPDALSARSAVRQPVMHPSNPVTTMTVQDSFAARLIARPYRSARGPTRRATPVSGTSASRTVATPRTSSDGPRNRKMPNSSALCVDPGRNAAASVRPQCGPLPLRFDVYAGHTRCVFSTSTSDSRVSLTCG